MRLIIAREVEPAERERILTELELELANSYEEPGQASYDVWIPLELDDESVVHYIDDLPIGVRYFSVKGGEEWVQRLRQSFPIMTDEEVLARAQAARSDQERIEATYMLALIAGPELDEPVFTELKASLRHPSEDVRYAAILATGYTTWSALQEVLA